MSVLILTDFRHGWAIFGPLVDINTWKGVLLELPASEKFSGLFYPSAWIGLKGYCRRLPGGRAGATSHRYRSPGRSSYQIAVKLGGDESWGRFSDEFVDGRCGSLIKGLTS